jgi:uncharacterized protein (DUF1015 family)
MAKPKDDRLRLLRACNANLSPLMALYDDPDRRIAAELTTLTQGEPVAAITDDQGEQHRLWLVADPATQTRLAAYFADRQLFIADGHHRYETALAFRDEQREKHGDLGFDAAFNFVMMALAATDDPGLVVLPTHRLVRGLSAQVIAALPETLPQYWDVESLERADAAALTQRLTDAGAQGAHVAIVATRKHRWLLHLAPTGAERMRGMAAPPAWRELDVSLAQELILNGALGVTRDDIATGDYVSYTRKADDALAALTDDAAQVAVLLNPTRPGQVRDVAQAGGRMPQKSTYFYPKLITGLVINPVW